MAACWNPQFGARRAHPKLRPPQRKKANRNPGDTDLRIFEREWVIGSLSRGGVAYARRHVGSRHCFAAFAQPLTAASTLPLLLLPPPATTAGRLFQRARLRIDHGAHSAYLSRWPSRARPELPD